MSSRNNRSIIAIVASLLFFTWLIISSYINRPAIDPSAPAWVLWITFGLLLVFTTTFGIRLGAGSVSLLPMTTAAACLVVGVLPAAWLAFLAAWFHALVRFRFSTALGEKRDESWLVASGKGALNAIIQSACVLVAGKVYQLLDGEIPLNVVTPELILPLAALGLVYLIVNYSLVGLYLASIDRTILGHYMSSLRSSLAYEAAPLIFAPFMALVYTRLGIDMFWLFSLSLIVWSLITRSLAEARNRLERRVKELDSLQAVGQALTASLDLDVILQAIYQAVASLMPAENFYVAFLDPENGEVSFPLVVEAGQPARWKSRKAGNGLTEHLIRTSQPLLLAGNTPVKIQKLGLASVGKPAACWLGVPIQSADRPLGVIAVQSYTSPEAYDASHQEVLTTIAAQASVAIQNASLYAQTDEALARRVQELDLILRTTAEGILLFDLSWHVLAANAALARYFGLPQSDIQGRLLDESDPDGSPALLASFQYTPDELENECNSLLNNLSGIVKTPISLTEPAAVFLERTLAPVFNRRGNIFAWLLVFRDITEEVKLARMREDMMHMLIHDLRSPLAMLTSSLETTREILPSEQCSEDVDRLLELAIKGSDRMMGLVNELLEINKLEGGEVPLEKTPNPVLALLQEVAGQFSPLASAAGLDIRVEASADLPPVCMDQLQINRVLHNLLDNAVKFTPNGGKIVVWARPDPATDGRMMWFGITDNGPGIAPEHQERIFQKFQRVASIKGRRLGTGLGLAYCKLAVEAHGGEIFVESREGKGSTFKFRLPV